MKYTTTDYLRDNYWFVDFPASLWEKVKPIVKKKIDSIIEFEYDEYIFRIADNLPYAVIIIFLGLFAVLTLAKYIERDNGVRVTTITTNSMDPTIAPGSIIIESPDDKYLKGDIISYKEINPKTGVETGRAVTHRIIDVKTNDGKNTFITKGDSNEHPDPGEISKNQILGKVFIIIPFLGYFDVIVKTIPGFIIFIVIPSILLIKNELKFLKEEGRFSGNLKKRNLVGL